MKMYKVFGVEKGLSEIILSESKKDAMLVTKISGGRVMAIDKKPKLRIAVGGENELLDYLEWRDVFCGQWNHYFTVDPRMYKECETEVLRNMD